MSSRTAWIYGGIAVAAGVGLVIAVSSDGSVDAPAAKPPVIRPGARLMLVGDSLAQGLAVPFRQLSADAGMAFQANAVQGSKIADWAAKPSFAKALEQWKPTLLLVSLGANDMKMADPAVERPALEVISKTLRSSGADVVWLAPPAMPFPDRGVRAMIAGSNLPVFHSEMLTLPRGPDGIHPTAASFAGWAGALWLRLGAGLQALSALGAAPQKNRTRRGEQDPSAGSALPPKRQGWRTESERVGTPYHARRRRA